MSEQPRPVDSAGWRQLTSLGEQLVAQQSVVAQREIIEKVTTRLVPGQVTLWLEETLCRLPGSAEPFPFPPQPDSELMRQALDARQLTLDVKDGLQPPNAVAVPLLIHQVVLGVLEVKREDAPFSSVEVDWVGGLAAQAAIALQAARQVAVERWRIEQLSLVRKVSAQIASLVDLDELGRQVTDLVLDTFHYYYVALFTLEPGQEILRMRASAGPDDSPQPDNPLPPNLQVHLGQGMIGHAAQEGLEIIARDVNHEPHYRHIEVLPETRSEVVLPLKIEARVLGVLDVQSNQLDDFGETDLIVLRALADQVAIAVEEARIHGELLRRADQLSVVAEISRSVASILDLDALFDQVVQLIHQQFGYPFVHLLTADYGRKQIVYRAGSGPLGQVLQMQTEEPVSCSMDDLEEIVPYVVRHGEIVLTNDLSQDSRYRPAEFSEAGVYSELAVPLIFGDEVLGVLDIQSDQRGAFGEDDRLLFNALSDNIAIAIRNANLYRSEQWRRQVADSMREVAGLLSANIPLDQIISTILIELEAMLPCEVVAIWLLEEENLCLASALGATAGHCVTELSPDVDSWLWEVLNGDQPVVRTPETPPEPLGTALGFSADYSVIAAPLRAGGRPLGVLTLVHSAPGRYGTESRAMTAAFASYAAVAIENTRLYEAAQELASISTVMLQVAKATQSLTTLDQVLATVVNIMPMLVGVDRCAILLWDDVTDSFIPAAAYGLNDDQQTVFEQWRIALGDQPAFDDLRLSGAPVFVYDVAIDARLSEAIVWSLGFESLLLLPLLAQGEVLGVMLVDYQGNWTEFTVLETAPYDERLAIIQGITNQTATAVENTLLRESQQEEAYVSAALLQVAQAVASLNELDDILSVIVRITPILVGVERCVIFLWDEEHEAFYPAQAYGVPPSSENTGDGPSLWTRRYTRGEFDLLDQIRDQDHSLVYALAELQDGSTNAADPAMPALPAEFTVEFVGDAKEETCSLLAVPLSVKGTVLGVMLLLEEAMGHRSRDRRMEIITGIAQQAALAAQNDRLQQEMAERERLERELQLAREIQQTLMPKQLPDLPGWEMAVLCRPARQVGGDFYDFFELPGGRLGLVIADVADKGMPAALFMALARTLVRAAALEETSPAAVLERVNSLLVPDAHQGMFVTALYAVLSLETGELVYANAGHNPPLLLRASSRKPERFATGGMALGVLDESFSEDTTVTLEINDCVIFYTDGITEAIAATEEFYGEARLSAVIQETHTGSAQEMLDAIEDSVAAFVGDLPPADDLTLMVLRQI